MEVKKIVEGMTAPQVAQVIDDNFKAQNAILEEDIAKQNNVIGVSEYKNFSEAEAVNVGDVRKYNGFLYECVKATTGAFDASKWKKSSFKAQTEKEMSFIGKSTTVLKLKGNGDVWAESNETIAVKGGNIYRIWIKNNNIDLTGVYTPTIFGIIGFYESSPNYGLMPDVLITNGSRLNDYYDIIIPNDVDKYNLKLSGRLAKGFELIGILENISGQCIKDNVEFGTYHTDTGELVEAENRLRSKAIYFEKPSSKHIYINYECPSTLTPNLVANAYKGSVFVKKIEFTAKRGAIAIPYDGTFDNVRIGFKKADGSNANISESEKDNTFIYNKKPFDGLKESISREAERIDAIKNTIENYHTSNILTAKGDDNTLAYSNLYNGIVPGNIYRIKLKNKDIDLSGVTVEGNNTSIFGIAAKSKNDPLYYGLMPDVKYGEKLEEYYDVIIPSDFTSHSLALVCRATKGEEIECVIENITEVKKGERLELGTFNLSDGKLVDSQDRVRSSAVFFGSPRSNIYINYKSSKGLVPTLLAVGYMGNSYVKRLSYEDKRGTVKIPYDGTFDNVRIAFKKSDGSDITEEELSDIILYSNKMVSSSNMSDTNKSIYNLDLGFELGKIADNGNPYGGITSLGTASMSRQSLFLKYDVENEDIIVSDIGSAIIFCYDKDLKFIGKVSTLDSLHGNTKYIKLMYDGFVREKTISIESFNTPILQKNGMRYDREYPTYVSLSYEVKIPTKGDVTPTLEYTGKDNVLTWTNGYIYLPHNYNVFGKAVPLIIFCHGTGGFEWGQTSVPNYEEYVKFLCKNGYAVADCTILTNRNQDKGIRDINVGNALALECYTKLYRYIVSNFNIEEGVYIFGKSAGGLNSVVLSYMQPFPIRTCGGLAPSLDILINMRAISPSADINWSFGELGIETNYSGYNPLGNPTNEQREYLVSNYKKTAPYNPMLIGTVNLDTEMFYNKTLSLGLLNFEADEELKEVVNKASKIQAFPYKIWHAVDDDAVPIASIRFYKKMVENGGGLCVLREFPANCGKHHAVDYDVNAPRVDYLCKNGETINVPVAYAELLDWFNQW